MSMTANNDKVPLRDRIQIEINPELTAKITYLVEKGIYQDTVSFLEQAIQAQLNLHEQTFKELDKIKNLVIGWLHITASDLERTAAKGSTRDIKVLGVLSIAEDVSPELFQRAISKININGVIRASHEIKKLANQRRFSLLGTKFQDERFFLDPSED